MPKKIGGGGKPENYDPENGEYSRNPQCESDEKHLVYNKLFGLELDKPIQYPVFGIHDQQYCELIIKYCLDTRHPIINSDKITKYLLVYKPINDKSSLLKELGYTLTNSDELYYQIIRGSDFRKRRFRSFNEYALTFNVGTKIYNKINGKMFHCTTAWKINKDFTVSFVTLIPEEFDYGD